LRKVTTVRAATGVGDSTGVGLGVGDAVGVAVASFACSGVEVSPQATLPNRIAATTMVFASMAVVEG